MFPRNIYNDVILVLDLFGMLGYCTNMPWLDQVTLVHFLFWDLELTIFQFELYV